MTLPSRHMLLGMTLGALCATALATTGPGAVTRAFADETDAGFDAEGLVKFDDRTYRVDYEPWVATDPLSTAQIKKIEAGRVSYVGVTTTATGTYSTDGLTSRHVLYPGITVDPAETSRNLFAYWTGGGWASFTSRGGDSFVFLHNP